MSPQNNCNKFTDANYPNYIVEYRGDLLASLNKIDYACGTLINNTFAIIAVESAKLSQLKADIPEIIFIENRSPYVLQSITPSNIEGISEPLINPYLNLTGSGVLVGIVDTGIDYFNEEFINGDGTSRIFSIWDQECPSTNENSPYIGRIFNNSEINEAILAKKNGKDPYSIVPSKDTIGHGTSIASIIGANGKNPNVKGIAINCEFVIVKLYQSQSYYKEQLENGLNPIPAYNNTEVIAAVEFLKNTSKVQQKPIVIYIGVGGTQGSHTGNNLTSKYLSSIANNRGIILVIGIGNEGSAEGHVTNYVKTTNSTSTVELNIPKIIRHLNFSAWIKSPNKMSVSLSSPAGESTDIIKANIFTKKHFDFVLDNTQLNIQIYDPEEYTGQEVMYFEFGNIKPGIWKITFYGEYIVDGRYDLWLEPESFIPKGIKFLNPNPLNTIAIPSTALKTITTTYFDSINNTILSTSGRGFNVDSKINPDITAPGINIFTTSPGGREIKLSGSSAATAIVVGVCTLLVQWGIVNKNDSSMYSAKLRSYLIYGAIEKNLETYPNEITGYGYLSLENIFYVIAGIYKNSFINNSNSNSPLIRADLFSYNNFVKRSDLFI